MLAWVAAAVLAAGAVAAVICVLRDEARTIGTRPGSDQFDR